MAHGVRVRLRIGLLEIGIDLIWKVWIMRRYRLLRKIMVSASLLMAGGTVMGNGCVNTVASLPICGGLLAFCDSFDQINFLFPILETPDFRQDPSCTIPLGCGGGDLFDIPINPNPNGPQLPGGGPPDQPVDDTPPPGGTGS